MNLKPAWKILQYEKERKKIIAQKTPQSQQQQTPKEHRTKNHKKGIHLQSIHYLLITLSNILTVIESLCANNKKNVNENLYAR